jgi:threonine synthase
VTEDEIVEGIELLARTTGIFTETAGGVTTAVLTKLARDGRISPGERVVLYVTGDGLKTLDAVASRVERVDVAPTVASFEEALGEARLVA